MTGNQRWTEGRDTYRPAGEPIDTRAHEVVEIPRETAKAFVEAHHYSRSFPAARWSFGLFRRGELVGAAVFSHPCRNAVITNVFRGWRATDGVELGRFVLLDDVAGNGETWFLGRCFALLRGHVGGVVSFSDPVPRVDAGGRVVMPGHVGTIYQAHNGRYLGRSSPATLRLFPDGTVLSNRTMSKIRGDERGQDGAAAELERWGAEPLGDRVGAEARAWLARWRSALTRPMRHHGNHRYAWIIDRRRRDALPAAVGPYPKRRSA